MNIHDTLRWLAFEAGGPGSGRYKINWGLSKHNKALFEKHGITTKMVAIKKLVPSEYNNWKEAQKQSGSKYVNDLVNGMKKGALVYPIEVEKNRSGGYDVLDGHHRYLAALSLGESKVAVFQSPSDKATDDLVINLQDQKVNR